MKLVVSTSMGWKEPPVNDPVPRGPGRELGKAEERWEFPAEEGGTGRWCPRKKQENRSAHEDQSLPGRG